MNISYMAMPGVYGRSEGKRAEDIINAVCEYFFISHDDLVSFNRKRELVYARQLVCWLIRNKTKCTTLKRIGRLLGGRDHTTIIYAVDTINDLIFSDSSVMEDIKCIEKLY